jgi:predicted DNA-binding protein (MmcQ/YjbR family)
LSLKVKEEEFNELINMPGIMPAPYVAKHKWILIVDPTVFSLKELEAYILQYYDLVKSKIPKKKLDSLTYLLPDNNLNISSRHISQLSSTNKQ